MWAYCLTFCIRSPGDYLIDTFRLLTDNLKDIDVALSQMKFDEKVSVQIEDSASQDSQEAIYYYGGAWGFRRTICTRGR